jgi:hypothetical protein
MQQYEYKGTQMTTVLNNVTFAYIKIQNPVKGLNEGDTEFSVDCILSKADAKQWNKDHPKNKYKNFDNDEFLEKYKFDEVPFEDQDEQFVVKFKKAHSKKGVELPEKFRPRVFVPVKGGKPKDVTFDLLVANGSKGKVAYSTFSNSFGEFVQLDSILVEDLIEYEGAGSGVVGSAFGAEEVAEVPASAKKTVQKQGETEEEDEKPKVAPKKPSKPKAPIEDEDDTDSPF